MSKVNPNYIIIGGIVLAGLYMMTQTTKQLYKETLDKVPTDTPKQGSLQPSSPQPFVLK